MSNSGFPFEAVTASENVITAELLPFTTSSTTSPIKVRRGIGDTLPTGTFPPGLPPQVDFGVVKGWCFANGDEDAATSPTAFTPIGGVPLGTPPMSFPFTPGPGSTLCLTPPPLVPVGAEAFLALGVVRRDAMGTILGGDYILVPASGLFTYTTSATQDQIGFGLAFAIDTAFVAGNIACTVAYDSGASKLTVDCSGMFNPTDLLWGYFIVF